MCDGQVRHWFRLMRTRDHLRDPDGLRALQRYVNMEWGIARVGRCHLYDSALPAAKAAAEHLAERYRISEMARRLRPHGIVD